MYALQRVIYRLKLGSYLTHLTYRMCRVYNSNTLNALTFLFSSKMRFLTKDSGCRREKGIKSSDVLLCSPQVEISLQSSFQPGMKLEVANKSCPDTYWVATIITTCGQLLLLRYSGYGDDRKADFWCDVMTAELHPVGWCTQNNKTLMPPEGKKKHWGASASTLTHSQTVLANVDTKPW